MPEAVYLLCALTSMVCAFLLLRQYRQVRTPLLFWSSLCYGLLALNNLELFIDLVLLPSTIDLSIVRALTALLAGMLLVYGLTRATSEQGQA